eukprot:362622-Chlamydomonas_euryale.AAC.8
MAHAFWPTAAGVAAAAVDAAGVAAAGVAAAGVAAAAVAAAGDRERAMVMHHARTRSAKLLTGCERLAFGQVQPASVQPDVPERKYLDRKYSNRGHLIRGAAVSTVLTAALAFPGNDGGLGVPSRAAALVTAAAEAAPPGDLFIYHV